MKFTSRKPKIESHTAYSFDRLPDTDGEQKEEREETEKHGPKGPISRNRIESLSDLVFGLTLSIGALNLITTPPTDPGEMNARIIAFLFNFVILIAIWVQYTTIMSCLDCRSRRGRSFSPI